MPVAGGATPRPDLDRLLADVAELASICDPDEPGTTRRVLTAEYARGRDFVAQQMTTAGLDVEIDGGGNVIGRRGGVAPALVTGSHTDTVSGGGRLDGMLGVLGAIEAVRALDDAGIDLDHELRIIDFLGEEPNDWGISCLGSRALAGEIGPHELACQSPDGTSLEDALRRFGVDPVRAGDSAWGQNDVHAFVELHIEQGPVLEAADLPIGVVTGIVGVDRFIAEFRGRRDHAGTMPMAGRRDAVTAAAEMIVAVEELASDGNGVGTCGRIEVEPGAINVVPDRAQVSVELRSIDPDWLADRRAGVEGRAHEAGERRGVSVAISDLSHESPTPMHPDVQATVAEAADRLDLASMPLPSGAEHDTRRMAKLGPSGMIFVPSIGGRSHCPEEDTDPTHLEAGVATLALTLALLDQT